MVDPTLQEQIDNILSLEDDGEGNPLNYQRSTIEAALEKVPSMKELVKNEKNVEITDPEVLPGPDDSIDIHWDVEGHYEILLNVKPNGSASYFANFYDGSPLKGSLD